MEWLMSLSSHPTNFSSEGMTRVFFWGGGEKKKPVVIKKWGKEGKKNPPSISRFSAAFPDPQMMSRQDEPTGGH